MSATVMVFDHPWFAVPDEDGRFELPAVPAGDRESRRGTSGSATRRCGSASSLAGRPRRISSSGARAVRRPPRLIARTLAVTFVTVAIILSVVFIVLTLDARSASARQRSEG